MHNFEQDISKYAVVIPSLNPTDKLNIVVNELLKIGFKHIVVVDDGSSPEFQSRFSKIESIPGCVVLRHEKNLGKGAGLRTAFKYLIEESGDIEGAVTADGDGQHMPSDIAACTLASMREPKALIMGTRDFSAEGVPTKSRMGNKITRTVFRVACGIKLSDTQTGLRAMSKELFPKMLRIKGDRYEYETNMLLTLNRAGVPFIENKIETVYEDNNSCSHFRAFSDSVRIYGLIFRYLFSSVASFLLDMLAFSLAHLLLGESLGGYAPLVCTVIARAISSFFNFNVNKRLVFESERSYGSAMGRYYILCVLVMCASAGLLSLISMALGRDNTVELTVIKAVVDTILFILTFRIQNSWVFKTESDKQADLNK